MKQQATTVINDNRVNDAHTTQLDAHERKATLLQHIHSKYVAYR